MKRYHVIGIAVLTGFIIGCAVPAHAISHDYHAQLERDYKTQVDDTNGSYKPRSAIDDANAVLNDDIGHAADYLLSQGWKPNNGSWHKGDYVIRLAVKNSKVINAQVM